MSSVKRCAVPILFLLACALPAQERPNPRFTFSLDGPCGEALVGPPGSVYDDGTGGGPYFSGDPPGHTWDVVLTTTDNPDEFVGAHAWSFGLGIEGPLRITAITTNGTAGCLIGVFPECLRFPGGAETSKLTGPPDGQGPQTEDNIGAISFVLLKWDGIVTLPPGGGVAVAKIRISGRFPATEGEVATGAVFFTSDRIGVSNPLPVRVSWDSERLTQEIGSPPLAVEDCVVSLKASSVAAFVRCDPNDDGQIDISDAVWILSELFELGAATRCRTASDCNGDDGTDIGDAVYALSYLFNGGPAPPAPFPDCRRLDVPLEDCPPGSTICP
jgi:hypothetical protein